jgi:phage host-nuclease inhibitor protein Gam
MKKAKITPLIVTSREAMEAIVADIVSLKLDHVQRTALMEKEIADVQKRHQEGILTVAQQIQIKEAGVYTYCQAHRKELFADKKSLDLLLATIGFRDNPPSVEKATRKDTWDDIARRLETTEWGKDYLREVAPEVSKVKLLADREKLSVDQLREVGVKIDQDEEFFIKPKSEVAEESKQDAV